MTFEPRERLIFETLRELRNLELVLIGGLALNAYVPPRFSIDCDLVLRRRGVAARVGRVLEKWGFEKLSEGKTTPPGGEFIVYTRRVDGLRANFDLLVGAVTDRWSGAVFDAEWFFARSRVRRIWARAVPIWVEVRTADPEVLFIMKLLTARKQDIRDAFMLAGLDLDWEYIGRWVKDVPQRVATGGVRKCRALVESVDFKDGLHGAFGKVERTVFERCKRRLTGFLEGLGF
jgi:hypothetical protein